MCILFSLCFLYLLKLNIIFKCIECAACRNGFAMPVYDEAELDAINEASEDMFKRKLAVWRTTSKKNRTKAEPRRSAPSVQEFVRKSCRKKMHVQSMCLDLYGRV